MTINNLKPKDRISSRTDPLYESPRSVLRTYTLTPELIMVSFISPSTELSSTPGVDFSKLK